MMSDDMALVREYARNSSEAAFAILIERHINLVFSVARRAVRDPHLAEEVTQAVFIILAQKAGALTPRTILSGWLCRTARHVSAKALTVQRRRQHREQQAYMQSHLNETESNVWMEIEPLLETAMADLGKKDHDAVVLRFFEGRSFKEAGAALGTTEAGVKMRVNRAIEKLRKFFTTRGLTLSAAVIAASITANSVQAAPIGLTTSVTVAAVKGAGVTTSTLTLINTTLKIMAWTKLKTAVVVGVIAIMAAGTATVTIQRARVKAGASPFTFAGYATPEASMQSMIWTARTGDFDKVLAGLTSSEAARFKSMMAGKSDDEIRHGMMAWANAMTGYKITQKEVIADDEVHLHVHATPSAEALHTGKAVIVMKKIGNEWKQSGVAN
jgi:RNA polymerase sigma factor (sigma-70 family)